LGKIKILHPQKYPISYGYEVNIVNSEKDSEVVILCLKMPFHQLFKKEGSRIFK